MSLLNRIRGFFSSIQRTSPLRKTDKKGEGSERIEMSTLEWFNNSSFELNGDSWEILSKEEIAETVKEKVASSYARLDQENAAARNAFRKPTEDIGQREVKEGFVELYTPHEKAVEFGELLDNFNTEEPSFVF